MKIYKYHDWVIVIIISLLFSLLSGLTFFLLVTHTPQDTLRISATHYWEDYMYYVSQFNQGAHHAVLNHAMYTEEPIQPNLLHFPNVWLGNIGPLLHVTPMDMYNISVILCSFIFLLLSFFILKHTFHGKIYAIPAFLFFLLSEPFMNKLPPSSPVPYFPFHLWGTPQYILTRIGILPHSLIANISICLIIYLLFTTPSRIPLIIQKLVIALLVGMVVLLQPVAITLVIGVYGLTTLLWKYRHQWTNVVALAIGYIAGVGYMFYLFKTNFYVQAMTGETLWQVRTEPLFLLESIGPIVPFAVVGMLTRWKKAMPIERFGMLIVVISYTAFYFPLSERVGVSNVRLLFSVLYLFLGWFAAVGLFQLAAMLSSRLRVAKRVVVGIGFIVFLLCVTPTLIWEIQQKIPDQASYQSPTLFLPQTTADAFAFLETQKPKNALVLANPTTRMDIFIPVLTGHRSVTGLHYTTVDADKKQNDAYKIFLCQTPSDEARSWFEEHHISFVLFTTSDGNVQQFEKQYPFLHEVFRTTTAIVYRVE